jgi:hypothetical protein
LPALRKEPRPYTSYFFGLKEDYFQEDEDKIPLLMTSAYSALDDKTSIQGNKAAQAQQYVAAIAENMLGKKCAYCNLGRERSAIAVFAFLYVKLKMTKADAFAKVREAVDVSAANMPNKQAILYQVDKAIVESMGYAFLPAVYP